MTINILHAGLVLPQDAGRFDYVNVGVSTSGAFDKYSYRLLGSLMGRNSQESYPALEILSGTLSLRIEEDSLFSVVGDGQVSIDGQYVSINTLLNIKSGQNLYVEPLGSSPVYLSIDGMSLPKVLDSVSYDSMSAIGNKPLQRGDTIEIKEENKRYPVVGWFSRHSKRNEHKTIRFIESYKSEGKISNFSNILMERNWKVISRSRSGIRLLLDSDQNAYSNEELEILSSSGSLKSMPVLPGTIQLPKSGEPIILGPDSGITGGYPVAGVVMTADLYKLANLKEGSEISFKPVSIETAEAEYIKQEKDLNKSIVKIENLA